MKLIRFIRDVFEIKLSNIYFIEGVCMQKLQLILSNKSRVTEIFAR